MVTADHEPEFARTLADAQRSWKDEPPITISLPRGDAWLLLTAAQQRRHDRWVDWDLGKDLERVGRVVQNAVCVPSDPDLSMLAEAGWNPTFDFALASGVRSQPSTRYAFLIETSDNGKTWMQDLATFEGCPAGAGVEQVHDPAPEDYARRVLARRFAQLRGDDAYDWEDLWFRACVWDIDRATDYRWGVAHRDEPGKPDLYAKWLQANGCDPHAVEIRTPSQVPDEISGSHAQPSPMR